MQEYPLRRPGPDVGQGLAVPERPLDGLAHLLLEPVQAADVVPADVGRLHEHLAQRRRAYLAQRAAQVRLGDAYAAERLGRDPVGVQVHLGQDAPQGPHGRLLCERLEVGADEPVGRPGRAPEVHAVG